MFPNLKRHRVPLMDNRVMFIVVFHIWNHTRIFQWTKFVYLIYKIVIVGRRVYACSLIALERKHKFAPNFVCSCLETRKRFYKGQYFEQVCWVRVPARVVSAARKLSTIEERRQDQSCFNSTRRKQEQRP
jgi:hypothetical protein